MLLLRMLRVVQLRRGRNALLPRHTGTAASYMGIALICDLSALPLALWLGPALAITGALLLAGLLLEARKLKVRTGTANCRCWPSQLACAAPTRSHCRACRSRGLAHMTVLPTSATWCQQSLLPLATKMPDSRRGMYSHRLPAAWQALWHPALR